jgi:TonB family protein
MPTAFFRLVLLSVLFAATSFAQSDKPEPNSAVPVTDSSTKTSSANDTTRLVITHFVQPVYPLEAMRQKLQGHVVIHLVISPAGDVLSAEPVSGNPIFTQSAVEAMKKWKFQPYLHNGQPVQIGYKMPYDFAISDRVHDLPDSAAGPPTSELKPPSGAPASSTASTNQGADNHGQGSAPGSDASSVAQHVQISQGTSQHMLVHQVAPVYPDSARRNLVQGTVVLKAIIGQDGRIKDLRPISGPQELYESAVGAVEQWRYKPFLLEGKPVEVETTINVNYKLAR